MTLVHDGTVRVFHVHAQTLQHTRARDSDVIMVEGWQYALSSTSLTSSATAVERPTTCTHERESEEILHQIETSVHVMN